MSYLNKQITRVMICGLENGMHFIDLGFSWRVATLSAGHIKQVSFPHEFKHQIFTFIQTNEIVCFFNHRAQIWRALELLGVRVLKLSIGPTSNHNVAVPESGLYASLE